MGSCRALLLSVVLFGLALPAQATEIATTTEYGITITADDLINALLESQALWPGIKKHLLSDKCTAAAPEIRKQGVDFLNKVDDQITKKVLGAADADVQDALDFLSMRLRKFALYKELRTLLNDDIQLARLKDRWEDNRYKLNGSPEANWPAESERMLGEIKADMQALGFDQAKLDAALAIFVRMDLVNNRMCTTNLGRMVLSYENEMRGADPKLKHLMRHVVRAADWAMITRAKATTPVRASDFVKAWEVCAGFEQTASLKK